MAPEGGEHRHCKVCGRMIDPQLEFCSKSCRRQREATLQGRRNLTYLIYGGIAFFVLLLLLEYAH